MKLGNKLFWLAMGVVIGVFTTYVSMNFYFFKLDFEINILSMFIDITTIIVGLHIATSIQHNVNKYQNRYSFIEVRVDDSWKSFILFSDSMYLDTQLSLENVTKFMKKFDQDIVRLKTVLLSFGIDASKIDSIVATMDRFEAYLVALPISNNIVSLSGAQSSNDQFINSINKEFAALIQFLQEGK